MFVTNWISTTKIQKISEITNFFRHYFLSRTEVLSCNNWQLARESTSEQVLVSSIGGNGLTLAIRYMSSTSFSYVLLRLKNDFHTRVTAPASLMWDSSTLSKYTVTGNARKEPYAPKWF